MTAHNALDLTNQRFGQLVALHRHGRVGRNAGWMCRCDCGVERVVSAMHLRSGHTKTCGQWTRHPPLPNRFTREYNSWQSMWSRCTYVKNKGYKNYGGRGITVCERWKSFKNFVEDMGAKPTPKHTIERKDVNGNYEADNCCWATAAEQARNMRRSVFVMYKGKRTLLCALIDNTNLSFGVVNGRIKMGWPLEKALSTPVHVKKVVDKNTKPVLLLDMPDWDAVWK